MYTVKINAKFELRIIKRHLKATNNQVCVLLFKSFCELRWTLHIGGVESLKMFPWQLCYFENHWMVVVQTVGRRVEEGPYVCWLEGVLRIEEPLQLSVFHLEVLPCH